jgi:hypothetical protein
MAFVQYTPVLKWRQGEYQAILRLNAPTKPFVRPLVEVTPPDFDFEEWQPKKTLDEHLEKVPSRLSQKWSGRVSFLDTGLIDASARMADGSVPLGWLLTRCRIEGATTIPVTGFERSLAHQTEVRRAHAVDRRGVAIRISLEEASDVDFAMNLEGLLEQIGVEISDTDLLLDLGAPNFHPIDGLATLVAGICRDSSAFSTCRSLTVIATAFPESMAMVTGPVQFWHRHEWLLYKSIVAKLPVGFAHPNFGDYTISHPEFAQGDMRFLKPSATIRYAVDDGWQIAKGQNVRDYGFAQYRNCCASITTSAGYLGTGFSAGSQYIERCRAGLAKTGNLSTWRWVGVNQHIEKVVHDLASFAAPSASHALYGEVA